MYSHIHIDQHLYMHMTKNLHSLHILYIHKLLKIAILISLPFYNLNFKLNGVL